MGMRNKRVLQEIIGVIIGVLAVVGIASLFFSFFFIKMLPEMKGSFSTQGNIISTLFDLFPVFYFAVTLIVAVFLGAGMTSFINHERGCVYGIILGAFFGLPTLFIEFNKYGIIYSILVIFSGLLGGHLGKNFKSKKDKISKNKRHIKN
jgi:hypothetical protein